MKITLKKGSVGAVPDIASSVVSPSETPTDSSAASVGGEELGSGPVAVGRQRKKADLFGIIFAVVGFVAVAVFVAMLILQGQEISFYKAPDSLWLK